MPAAARAKKTAERQAELAQGLHPAPRGPVPLDYPVWDNVHGNWRNEAGEPQPSATGTRNQVTVQQHRGQKTKRVARSGSAASGSVGSVARRRVEVDDMHVDPPALPSPRQVVQEVCSILSSNLIDEPSHAVFDVAGCGKIKACTTDDCGLVGSQVLIPNRSWGQQYDGSSKCIVVGYVDELRFTDTGAHAPACTVRTVVGKHHYAFR